MAGGQQCKNVRDACNRFRQVLLAAEEQQKLSASEKAAQG